MNQKIRDMINAYDGTLVVTMKYSRYGELTYCYDKSSKEPVFVVLTQLGTYWRHPTLCKSIMKESSEYLGYLIHKNHIFRTIEQVEELREITGGDEYLQSKNTLKKRREMEKEYGLPEGLSVNENKVEYAVGDSVFESTILIPKTNSDEEVKMDTVKKAKKEPNGIYVKKYYVEEDAMDAGGRDDMIEVIHAATKPTVIIEKKNDGTKRVWGSANLTKGMIEKIAKANGYYHDEIILNPYDENWGFKTTLKEDLKNTTMEELEAHWLDWACDIVHNHYERDKVIALVIKNKVLDVWNCPAEFFDGCYHKPTNNKK